MSPMLRRIQQSWWFHIVAAGAIAGGVTLFTCANTAGDFTIGCLKNGAIAAGLYIFATFQHSPGSASFNSDGTPNKIVDKVVAIEKGRSMPKFRVGEKVIYGPLNAGGTVTRVYDPKDGMDQMYDVEVALPSKYLANEDELKSEW